MTLHLLTSWVLKTGTRPNVLARLLEPRCLRANLMNDSRLVVERRVA